MGEERQQRSSESLSPLQKLQSTSLKTGRKLLLDWSLHKAAASTTMSHLKLNMHEDMCGTNSVQGEIVKQKRLRGFCNGK